MPASQHVDQTATSENTYILEAVRTPVRGGRQESPAPTTPQHPRRLAGPGLRIEAPSTPARPPSARYAPYPVGQARQGTASSHHRPIIRERSSAHLPDLDSLQVRVQNDIGRRLYVMKNQKRRDVWYFARLIPKQQFWEVPDSSLTNERGERAICLLCETTMKFRVGKHKMVEHMKEKHSTELGVYRQQRNLILTAGGGLQMQRTARRLDSELANVADPEKTVPIRIVTPKEQHQVNVLLARWIARHFRPMITVEDEGFIEFVSYITQELGRVKLVLPNRAKLRSDIVALAVHYRKRVQADIQRFCLYYSLTSDIWTGRDGRSYISLTIHYVTETFESRNWTLEVRELPGIHTGTRIAEAVDEMMGVWSLDKSFCTVFVRDGGSNMVSAAAKLHVVHIPCVAHCLHLVVAGMLIKKKTEREQQEEADLWLASVDNENDEPIIEHHEDEELAEEDRQEMASLRGMAIADIEEFLNATIVNLERNELALARKVVQHFRSLARYFRKSPKGQHRLGECQVIERGVQRGDALRIQVDCPTRWNSCWDMLQRFLVLQESLVSFFTYLRSPEGRVEFEDMANKLRRPKASDWLTIKCLITLLAPFANVTTALSGQQYPTLPLVAPIIYNIRKKLAQTNLFDDLIARAGDEDYVNETKVMMNDCRKIVLKLFDERFSGLSTSDLVWVAYLDPRVGKRMQDLTDMNAAEKKAIYENLVRAARLLAREHRGEPIHQTPMPSAPEAPSQGEDAFFDDLFGPDDDLEQRASVDQDCTDEFTLYLSDIKTVKKKQDPLVWWHVNGSKYPNLSRLARKWLGAVATSVSSERAFSTSGNILTVKRSSLTPSLVRDLVFIAQNWRIDYV